MNAGEHPSPPCHFALQRAALPVYGGSPHRLHPGPNLPDPGRGVLE